MKLFVRIPLAWLQLTRNKLRLIVALCGIAFAAILIFMQLAFLGSLYESQTAFPRRINADLVMISRKFRTLSKAPIRFPRQYLYRALNFEGVAAVNSIYYQRMFLKYAGAQGSKGIFVIGINPENSPLKLPEFEQVAHWLKIPMFALMDANSDLKEYGAILEELKQGQPVPVELQDQRVWIAAAIDFVGASFADDGNLITSTTTYGKLLGAVSEEDISIGLITLNPGVDQQMMLQELRQQLPDNLQVVTVADFLKLEEDYWRTGAPIGFIFTMGVLVGFLVGVIVVYQILYSEVSDHLSDYALLKVRGYKQRYFLKVLFQESLLLAVLGYIPGFAVSLGLYKYTQAATALPMNMTIPRAGFVLLLTIIMCFLSGMISIRKLQEADPADLFS
ncbi:MAG: ABC transporter permease DevC [Cyanobacteria bacterium P01_H01_bin.121]